MLITPDCIGSHDYLTPGAQDKRTNVQWVAKRTPKELYIQQGTMLCPLACAVRCLQGQVPAETEAVLLLPTARRRS